MIEQGIIVLRVAEIFLKGRNRRDFFKRLVRNAKQLLADIDDLRVEALYMRIVVHHPPGARDACIERLSRLFGMSSMSPAAAVECSVDAIANAALAAAREFPSGQTFKVTTKRRDKSFPLSSMELSRQIGGRIHTELGLPVDVHSPDHTLHLEIAEEGCFLSSRSIPGPGGLPVGSGANVSLLLSGGIDSPVAGFSAMRRGCHINGIYFHSFPYTGDKTKEKVIDLGRILARFQGNFALNVVHFTEVQKQLREHGPGELAVLLYRRMMMRAATIIAGNERAKALVTGENLGQVASQTVENIAVIEDASGLPILRPLITFDKNEIIDQAKRIGTFETSIRPYDDCCSLFVPKHPATKAKVKDLQRAERGLDVDALAASLAANVERIVITRAMDART